jgi:hypothetical protein
MLEHCPAGGCNGNRPGIPVYHRESDGSLYFGYATTDGGGRDALTRRRSGNVAFLADGGEKPERSKINFSDKTVHGA